MSTRHSHPALRLSFPPSTVTAGRADHPTAWLNHFCQVNGLVPHFLPPTRVGGHDHTPVWQVEVVVGNLVGVGAGRTSKEAKAAACMQLQSEVGELVPRGKQGGKINGGGRVGNGATGPPPLSGGGPQGDWRRRM